MHIGIIDGKVIFATHFINVIIPKEQRDIFHLFQIEPDGIVCYSELEKTQVESVLTEYNIPFTTETLSFNQDYKDKVAGIKYNSRSEAIAHLQEGIEPGSQIIVNLKKQNKELKDNLAQTEDTLLTLMFGG